MNIYTTSEFSTEIICNPLYQQFELVHSIWFPLIKNLSFWFMAFPNEGLYWEDLPIDIALVEFSPTVSTVSTAVATVSLLLVLLLESSAVIRYGIFNLWLDLCFRIIVGHQKHLVVFLTMNSAPNLILKNWNTNNFVMTSFFLCLRSQYNFRGNANFFSHN